MISTFATRTVRLATFALAMGLGAPLAAGPVSITLTEAPVFGSTQDAGALYSGTLDVSGYDGTSAGLFEVTGASFEVAIEDGSPRTFDSTDAEILFAVDGTLFAEFDAAGNLLDFVDDGDTGGILAGWGLRSVFSISEAAGTTKYDLYFDNSLADVSFWSLAPVTKTAGPGGFDLEFGDLFRFGTYATTVRAVPVGPTAPLLLLGLLAFMARRRAR